jgi:protein SCO1/2
MKYPRALPRLAAFVVALFAIALPAVVRADGAGRAEAQKHDVDQGEGRPIVPPGLEDVGVDEHLLGQVPLDAVFRDSTGKMVRFGDLLDGKHPVVLTLAYHTCPTVCSMVLSQTVEGLKQVEWSIGDQYRSITLSFDPREQLDREQAKKKQLVEQYGRAGADQGWAFISGDDQNIHRVTDAVGFKYHYVEREQQYAHPTVIMILTPAGKVARYLYGLEYSPNDIRLGLLEASEGRSISTVEKVLLYCYHYDPNAGRYVIIATRVMQIGAGLSGLALLAFLSVMWARERARSRRTPPPTDSKAAHAAAH